MHLQSQSDKSLSAIISSTATGEGYLQNCRNLLNLKTVGKGGGRISVVLVLRPTRLYKSVD